MPNIVHVNKVEANGQTVMSVPPLFMKWFSKLSSTLGYFFVFLFFCLPILKIFLMSFDGESSYSLANYGGLLSEVKTWKTVSNTLFISCGSTAVALLFGILNAWLIAYSDIRRKKIIQSIILLSFLVPSYVLTLSWTQFFSGDGLLARLLGAMAGKPVQPWSLYSFGGMILIMGLHHYPLVYLLSVSSFRKIPRDMEWAARASGMERWKTFLLVNLPLALPGIANGGMLAFLASLDNFGIPAFLGIPANISVFSTSIYEEMTGFGPSAMARCAALSCLLGIISILVSMVQWMILRKVKSLETGREDFVPRFPFGKYRNTIEVLVIGCLGFISFVPLVAMGFQSFLAAYGVPLELKNLTLANYEFVLLQNENVRHAIINSFWLSSISVLICLIVGTSIAYLRTRKKSIKYRVAEILISLPYVIPGVVFGLGMILTWMEPIPGWNPGIYGSTSILLIAYIGRFMILQVRSSFTSILHVNPETEEAARIFGMKRRSMWWSIIIPQILPGLIGGALLVFLTSLTELTVSSLLWSSGSETIGVIIFNFEQAGSSSYSTALSSLILLAIFVGAGCFNLLQKSWLKRGTTR